MHKKCELLWFPLKFGIGNQGLFNDLQLVWPGTKQTKDTKGKAPRVHLRDVIVGFPSQWNNGTTSHIKLNATCASHSIDEYHCNAVDRDGNPETYILFSLLSWVQFPWSQNHYFNSPITIKISSNTLTMLASYSWFEMGLKHIICKYFTNSSAFKDHRNIHRVSRPWKWRSKASRTSGNHVAQPLSGGAVKRTSYN